MAKRLLLVLSALIVLCLHLPLRIFAAEPLSGDQWGLRNTGSSVPVVVSDVKTVWISGKPGEDINAQSALAENPRRKVKIAVLDTGIDSAHIEFQSLLRRKESECQAQLDFLECKKKGPPAKCEALGKADTDNNGYALDCGGFDVTTNSGLMTDVVGHGTHVAGIIAARRNNVGVEGVIENVDLIPVRVLGADSPVEPKGALFFQEGAARLVMANVAKGLKYALNEGAEIINMSLGWPAFADSSEVRGLIKQAIDSGVLVVAAAGNDATDATVFPCAYTGVICVGAHDNSGRAAFFSNYGFSVDVMAPGLSILSSWPMAKVPVRFTERRGWDFRNGSSMAAPFVTGVLGRLLNAGFSPAEARARLFSGVREVLDGSYVNFGNIDLGKALQVEPRPLYGSVRRSMMRFAWRPEVQRIPFTFELENMWASEEGPVSVEARVVRRDDVKSAQLDFSLITRNWTLDKWPSQQKKEFATELLIGSQDPEGEAVLEIQIRGKSTQLVRLPFELFMNASETSVPRTFRPTPIQGLNINPNNLATISSLDGGGPHDYLLIDRQANGDSSLTLLRKESSSVVSISASTRKLPGVWPRLLKRMDWNQDGRDDYFLLFDSANEDGKRVLTFLFLDEKLQQLGQLTHVQDKILITANFAWMNVGGYLLPTWMGFGEPAVKEPFDPWDPNKKPEKKFRIYFLTANGLGEVIVDKEFMPAGVQQAGRSIEILAVAGQGFEKRQSFFVAEEGKVVREKPIQLASFKRLAGLESLGLVNNPQVKVFTSVTLEHGVQAVLLGEKTDETTLPQSSELDPIRKVSAVWGESQVSHFFAISKFHLVYRDVVKGQTTSTDIRRFSFLSAFHFDRMFSPVTLTDSRRVTPAMYVPQGIGAAMTTEVIVPRESGGDVRLIRPARYKIQVSGECRDMDPIAHQDGSNELVIACPGVFFTLPLSN